MRATVARLSFFGAISDRLSMGGNARDNDSTVAKRGRNESGSPLDYYLQQQSASSSTASSVSKVTDMRMIPRSALFVPCHKGKALGKVAKIGNDVDLFILDLEDSVPPELKSEARRNLTDFVSNGGLVLPQLDEGHDNQATENNKKSKCRAIVRINSLRTDPANAILDLEAVMALGAEIEGVAIPKVEVGDDEALAEYLRPSMSGRGRGIATHHQVWAFFETPRAILDADKICKSNFYQYGVMGLNDLSAEMGYPLQGTLAPHPAGRVQHYFAMSSVVTACRANGVIPLDGVFNDPTDGPGFQSELSECRRLGFDGKTLIHPSQVPACNAAFTPTPAEVHWAERVVQSVMHAGNGVAVLDGKMVEELHARQAAKLLTRRGDTPSKVVDTSE